MFAIMTLREASKKLILQLSERYNQQEARNITDLIMEKVTGWDAVNRIIQKQMLLSEPAIEVLEGFTSELMKGKPVQYVLGEAWFYKMKFVVTNAVLIPRPETEELVEWIIEDVRNGSKSGLSIIDIGTGSGCIAIALKKELADAAIVACDISDSAIGIAKKNAGINDVKISLIPINILAEEDYDTLPGFDIIVSNPPYILSSEAASLPHHVKNFEPAIALYVKEDPLEFYKAIATFGKKKLNPGGSIYVEVNEVYGKEVQELFILYGYNQCILKKDLQGRDRMVKAGR